MTEEALSQTAPFPWELKQLVDDIQYKQGWTFSLFPMDRGQESKGLTLVISVTVRNAYHPEKLIGVRHLMIVPAAAYDARSWRRWLFDQILLVEQHEAAEFFAIGDLHPYAANHGPGNDPYAIREMTTDEERRTSFRGEVKEG